jgi:protocatechuate 4,5-dioxygenase, beta chain
VVESLIDDEFDVTTCQEMLVDHAFTIPLALLWPEPNVRPVRTLPISINTVQHPLPSPARCFKLGQAVGRALDSYEPDLNVLILGTGGLSHQLDGKRAGFINKEFDLLCLDKLVSDPQTLARYSSIQIVEQAGSQGVELLNWIAMRGALTGRVGKVHGNYHVPISNTASALLVMENEPVARPTEFRKAS